MRLWRPAPPARYRDSALAARHRDVLFDNCISIHHTPFYEGPRPRVVRLDGVGITLEGLEIPFDIPPFILGGRTLCQVRPLAEATGADVAWDGDSETVSFTLGARSASCQIGSEIAYVNGSPRLLDEPPMLYDDHTVVPLRFVAEGLGFTVAWDGERYMADLRRP
ncbi:MAG TPA: copper amine oxidase N-terminal domain-containing protein [Symbiobacteriaceae bacterium]|nr:copper amine oxidase N-terminal domain-containing protein [Symbiobacteriaceae bacterium]